jgi:hypothetical protein
MQDNRLIAGVIQRLLDGHKHFINSCALRAEEGTTELTCELARLDGFEVAMRGMEYMPGPFSEVAAPVLQYLRQRRNQLLDCALRPGWKGRHN